MVVYYLFLIYQKYFSNQGTQVKQVRNLEPDVTQAWGTKIDNKFNRWAVRCAISIAIVQLCIWHGGEYLKKDVLHFLKKSWVFAKSIWETWAILVKKSSKIVGGFHLKGSGLSDNDHLALRKASLWNVFSEVHAAWTIPIHYSSSPMDAN